MLSERGRADVGTERTGGGCMQRGKEGKEGVGYLERVRRELATSSMGPDAPTALAKGHDRRVQSRDKRHSD